MKFTVLSKLEIWYTRVYAILVQDYEICIHSIAQTVHSLSESQVWLSNQTTLPEGIALIQ